VSFPEESEKGEAQDFVKPSGGLLLLISFSTMKSETNVDFLGVSVLAQIQHSFPHFQHEAKKGFRIINLKPFLGGFAGSQVNTQKGGCCIFSERLW
jgi:hypothetical protein